MPVPIWFTPSVLITPGETWVDPEQGIDNCDRLPSTGRGVPSQSRDWGTPLEGALRTVLWAVLWQRPPTLAPQSCNRHLSSDPSPSGLPFRPHILRALRLRINDPNAHLFIFGGVLEEGAYPLARRLLRGRMMEEIVRSQAPNKVLMATLLPIDQT